MPPKKRLIITKRLPPKKKGKLVVKPKGTLLPQPKKKIEKPAEAPSKKKPKMLVKKRLVITKRLPLNSDSDFQMRVKEEEQNIGKDINNKNHGYIGLSDSQAAEEKRKLRLKTKSKIGTLFRKVVGRPMNFKKGVRAQTIVGLIKLSLENKVPQKDLETIYNKYRKQMTA